MKLLDTLKVYSGSEERKIEIYQGDLTALTPDEAVDILVVSAFPNDYTPTPDSLIGALFEKGISVEQLANNKAQDLRETSSCWISQEIINPPPGIEFKRILCFEPLTRGKPPEVVGDIFLGAAWQQEIFESIDACRKFIALYSPEYLTFKMLAESF
jgi:hypothetical protein